MWKFMLQKIINILKKQIECHSFGTSNDNIAIVLYHFINSVSSVHIFNILTFLGELSSIIF